MIRITVPSLDETDFAAVRAVLETGQLVQGARLRDFEQALAQRVGVEHAVAVSNGTAALHLSLAVLDLRPGDVVLVTAYSWLATANVIELCGARPVFIDVRRDTFNMDPERLDEALREMMASRETARRVRAVLPVHAFGQMADLRAIGASARRYDLPVIEDAACALGASLDGRAAGSWGLCGCFSFHPRKAITTGEGGIVTTNSATLARRLRALRNHGLDPDSATPDFILAGFNYRMTEFQAALGRSQLARLDRLHAARRRLVERYRALLADSPLTLPAVPPGHAPAHQAFVVLLPPEAAPRRTQLIADLKAAGIETTLGTWHMPRTTYFRTKYGYKEGDFPATDAVFTRSLTLPLYETLTDEEQDRVVRALRDYPW